MYVCIIWFASWANSNSQSSKGSLGTFPRKIIEESRPQVLTIGGLSTGTQAMAIKKGCHMVIATQQKASYVSLKFEGI